MNRIRFQTVALAALVVASLGGAPVSAQTDPTAVNGPSAPVIPHNPDADVLASEMRMLTQNPRDLRALLSAAQISAKLGDTSAALAFYARAERVDPENPRIKAGRAQVLVKLERPGEALAMFQSAEQSGLPMGDYLADRGLAFDLLGAPHLAQRDYRAALQQGREDETVRRYALSLGITGKYDEAMRELDPLLRRSDRAAWRARAFILAMQGDVAGAERIAQSMMPGNMGLALAPFFRRLPQLSPADKAFAVHFGALTPTPTRIADAQLAPPFPAYVAERTPPPVAVAAVTPAPAPAPAPARGRRQPGRDREQPAQLAAMTSAARAPARQPDPDPLPPPPQYVAPMVQPIPAASIATPAPAPVQVASASTPAPELPAMRRASGRRSAAPKPAAPEASYDLGREPGSENVPIAPASRRARSAAPPGRAKADEDDGALANIVGGIEIPPEERAALEIPVEEAPARAAPPPKPASRPAPATSKPVAPPPARKAEPKPPPEPRRFWVQVGIGQNERLLPATWRKLVKDNPAAFRGRTPWWTPLRATNRLLTGPFKTAAEAQAFVNTLHKADVDSVAFTSEAGQKVTKLEVK